MDKPSSISLADLETVIGGVQVGPGIRAIGLGAGLLLGPEKIDTIDSPNMGSPPGITRVMDPIRPPALPGGATIKTR